MTTWCLGDFARRIARAPLADWKALVEAMPETCPKGCAHNCRQVCSDYARTQWQCAKQRSKRK